MKKPKKQWNFTQEGFENPVKESNRLLILPYEKLTFKINSNSFSGIRPPRFMR
jgi:hypothetical protein